MDKNASKEVKEPKTGDETRASDAPKARPQDKPKTRDRVSPIARLTAVYGKRPAAIKTAEQAVKKLGKRLLWDYPKLGYRRYLAIESKSARRGIPGGAAALLIAVLAVWLWPWSGALATGFEFSEFLARPAAKLYIDGELATSEIPPIHRTQLSHGEHTIRFVSPENQEHEMTIHVAAGQPTRWVMNFVENRMSTSSLNTEEESK